MTILKFYEKERESFQKEYELKLTDQEAQTIYRKLLRHFKISCPWKTIRFWGTQEKGRSYIHGSIKLPHNPSLGLLVHETAHKKVAKHTKKLMTLMKRMFAYCKKKNYWRKN